MARASFIPDDDIAVVGAATTTTTTGGVGLVSIEQAAELRAAGGGDDQGDEAPLDLLVVPLGGGGLISGSTIYTKTHHPTAATKTQPSDTHPRACRRTHSCTMSKPRFQRMSQEQETILGHNCALDIYSDPMAQRKV